MKQWKCEVCGYIHDGESPPDRCPVCSAPADRFVPVDSVDTASKKEGPLKRWRCKVCGYIHEGHEPPNVCPVCNADKSEFEEVEAATEEKHE